MSFFKKFFKNSNEKEIEKFHLIVESINSFEPKFKNFSDSELKAKTKEFKQRLSKNESLDSILPEAFALVREAGKRMLGQRHYDVQLIGGAVLHQGKIAEMKTGEGKTLAATLPVYLNGLTGKGVHIITVNDYLAKRDAVWMGQIYHALGLSTGCIIHETAYIYDPNYGGSTSIDSTDDEERDEERDAIGGFKVVESFLRPCSRKEAYSADITYGTNNEFGFDYLRDNMAKNQQDLVQRGFNFVIVDEIDSILIDEARTPLIISQPDFESSQMYKDFARITPKLKENIDYEIDEKHKTAILTEQGIEHLEKILGVGNIYEEKGIKFVHHLEQGLRAQAFFKKDRDYIVKDNKVIIVDEFTGRLMPGRRWSGGLHQAIEARERVDVQPESKTLATTTFQNYFRMYEKLSGMTGTALTSAEEFDKVYKLEVIAVPTNKPLIRKELSDRVYKKEQSKWRAIARDVKERNQKGQPVLIGTASIEKNEYLAKLLERDGVSCQILNAKNHEKEGQIIAQAGKLGRVTVATNMAGRGVDIILSGNPPDKEEADKIKALGGLHVIGTERHEARRIDDQLRGRAGRQGDQGSSQFFISLQDDILRVFGGDRIKSLMDMLKMPDDEPIEAKILSGAIEKAQARVEGMNFDVRKYVLDYDDVISKHRNKIYGLRKNILHKSYEELKDFVLEIVVKEIEKAIGSREELKTILPLPDGLELKKENIIEFSKKFFVQKQEKEGIENMAKICLYSCLSAIDFLWAGHLDDMEHLRDSVRLRAYGGKDPLIEYKTEGHRIFQDLEASVNSQISRTIFKLSMNN